MTHKDAIINRINELEYRHFEEGSNHLEHHCPTCRTCEKLRSLL